MCMGHGSPDFTLSTYISPQEIVYDCDKEMTMFIKEVIADEKEILSIEINDRYLLEVLS